MYQCHPSIGGPQEPVRLCAITGFSASAVSPVYRATTSFIRVILDFIRPLAENGSQGSLFGMVTVERNIRPLVSGSIPSRSKESFSSQNSPNRL